MRTYLGLVENVNRKLATIDQTRMLDTSVLGKAVHPRIFNTLQRIAAEDETRPRRAGGRGGPGV